MARIKKRGTSGQAKNFITRTQAVRKLQVSLPDFRRLCIFKGIYPREPRNKKKASKSSTPSTTFYYSKDIQYLLHEPLLAKFREHKALSKKIARALGRGDIGDAARLEKSGAARLSLDHIVKERYPTFVDALRDLDDALTLLFLFANLPSTSAVPPKTIALCQRLCLEFQHYIIVSHSLRKSFLSIKGIYYQATIQGQDIMWLVPYKFVQRVTGDVDFRIMGTFVEFYTTLLGFVNFRLFTSVGLVYPPKLNKKSEEQGAELEAFTLEGQGVGDMKDLGALEPAPIEKPIDEAKTQDLQQRADAIAAQVQDEDKVEKEEEPEKDEVDTFEVTGEGGEVLPQPQMSNSEAATLFAPFTFYLSRETPRHSLEFILRAFGCKRVGWDSVLGDGAFTSTESNPAITHQIVDRPPVEAARAPEAIPESANLERLPPGYRVPGRIYIQPQWIWDCINSGKLLRPDLYAPGATLPPHLSPWVKPKKGVYDPTLPLELQEEEGEAEIHAEEEEEAESEDDDEETGGIELLTVNDKSDDPLDNGMDVADSDESESEEEDGFEGFDDVGSVSSVEETENDLRQAELEAEVSGASLGNGEPAKSSARKKATKKKLEEEEELQRRLGMMSRRKRKLVEKMMYGKKRGDEEAELLRKKRRRLEKEGKRVST